MSYVEGRGDREQQRERKGREDVSEQVPGARGAGDADDGVVYLGRNSFKMKVGAQMTPPAGTPAPSRSTPTPPPSVTTSSAPLRTPRPSALAYRPVPASLEDQAGGGKGRTLAVLGLCMIAFSCGVVTTLAVDRLWPRAKPQCVAYQEAAIGPGAITPPPNPEPAVASPAVASPAVASPAVASPVLDAPAAPVPVAVVVSAPRAGRAAAAGTPSGRGRAVARNRPTAAAPKPSLETMNPTGMFVDPFAD
jgi:hypothetical protein